MQYFIFSIASLLCTSAIPLRDFYSFGKSAGDFEVGPTDDGGSGRINLSTNFSFFDTVYTSLFISNNGIISFNGHFSSPAPRMLPVPWPLIAPFWADVDTRENGTVWYGERSQDSLDLDRARRDVLEYFCQEDFVPNFIFVATWDKVPHYSKGSKVNTFQCILISDGMQSVTIFHYADGLIEWSSTSVSSPYQAQIGVDAGDEMLFENVSESGTPAIINITMTSNVGIDGIWAFKLDEEDSECTRGSLFQLIFKINTPCSSWRSDTSTDKSMDIADELINELTSYCDCNVVVHNNDIITNETFLCFLDSPSFVTYRAQLQGTMECPTLELISCIEQWLASVAVLNVNNQILYAESSCSVSISSLDEPECSLVSNTSSLKTTVSNNQVEQTKSSILIIIIATIAAVICLGVIIVIVVIIFACLRLKSRRKSQKDLSTKSPTACAHLNTCSNSVVERIDLSESHQYECVKIPTQKDEVIEVADVYEVLCSPCEAYSVQVFNGITENEENYEVVRYT